MPRNAGRRFPLGWIVFAVLVAGIGVAIWYYNRPDPVAVSLWTVQRGRVEATVANTRAGTVRAKRRARLAPSAGGLVSKLHVREGDSVQEGQVLLELWNKDLAAQIKLAESKTAAMRARAEETCLRADQAEREYQRQRQERDAGIASEDKIDRAQSEAASQRAACMAAKAIVEESQASVEVARAAMERTVLKAPFKGVVAFLEVELGEYVTPSPPGIPTPPAIDLIEDGPLYVDAPIDEVDVPQVRKGLTVQVTLDAFPTRIFPGRVRRVAPYVLDVAKQARTAEIEVELDETQGPSDLLPSYSADVEILVEARDAVLRVPTEAILQGDKVLVLAGGVLEERQIRTGIHNWKFTEVVSGLDEGERVVLSLDREGARAGAPAHEEASPGTVEALGR